MLNDLAATTSTQRMVDSALATAALLARAGALPATPPAGLELRAPQLPSPLAPLPQAAPAPLLAPAAGRELELQLDQITFRRLTTAADIARVAHLREEIQLPAATLNDPVFRTREKKEMKLAPSALSSATAS